MTRSFSGTHEYSPHCLELVLAEQFDEPDEVDQWYVTDHVNELTAFIEANICPRCQEHPLDYPAGSRVTRCRCVPVCGRCGGDEGWQEGGERFGLSHPAEWPVSPDDKNITARMIAEGRAEVVAATFTSGSDGRPVMVTEDGVAEVKLRPSPGGWAEFGFADDRD